MRITISSAEAVISRQNPSDRSIIKIIYTILSLRVFRSPLKAAGGAIFLLGSFPLYFVLYPDHLIDSTKAPDKSFGQIGPLLSNLSNNTFPYSRSRKRIVFSFSVFRFSEAYPTEPQSIPWFNTPRPATSPQNEIGLPTRSPLHAITWNHSASSCFRSSSI